MSPANPSLQGRLTRSARRFAALISTHPNTSALVFYAIVALTANFPVFPGDPARLSTSTTYDIAQTTWFLAYTPYAIVHAHNLFFTDLVNYPVGVNLAQNTGMPLLGLISAPITLLFGPVASINLLRWLAFVLSAYAAYWVFRRLVTWTPAAFVGGLLYGFSPYMVTQGSLHLNLTFVPLPPLIFYALYEICVVQKKSARRWGGVLGGLVIAQFFISAEVLATTGLVAFIALFYLFFSCIRDVPSRVTHAIRAIFYAFVPAAVALSYPVWFMFHGQAHYHGPAQGYTNVFNADFVGPFIPTVAQLVAPHRLAEIGSSFVAGQGDLSENGSYLGIPLILVTIYLVARFWRRLWPIYLSLVALTAFVLSLGPALVVDGRVVSLPVSLPFQKIAHLPLLNNLLPVRFSLYVVFFLAVILVLGLDWIHEDRMLARVDRVRPTRRQRIGRGGLFGGLVGVLTVVSLLPAFPYRSYRLHINWSESKPGLAIIPMGSRVLSYPYPTVYYDAPMLWQAIDKMRFHLFGSYALVSDVHGNASLMPVNLRPTIVQAMLENSVTPIPVIGVPDITATRSSMVASSISIVAADAPFHTSTRSGVIHAIADSVDEQNGTLVVWTHRLRPILIKTTASTTFSGDLRLHPGLSSIKMRTHLVISGTMTTGTVNESTAALLRRFVIKNHVDVCLVDLGLRDSGTIAQWFRLALGPPDRAGAGGEIWLDAVKKAETTAPLAH